MERIPSDNLFPVVTISHTSAHVYSTGGLKGFTLSQKFKTISFRQMASVIYMAEIGLHFVGAGPAGEGLSVGKTLSKAKVESLKYSIVSR